MALISNHFHYKSMRTCLAFYKWNSTSKGVTWKFSHIQNVVVTLQIQNLTQFDTTLRTKCKLKWWKIEQTTFNNCELRVTNLSDSNWSIVVKCNYSILSMLHSSRGFNISWALFLISKCSNFYNFRKFTFCLWE
jgi:hypothetical protein